MNGKTGNLIWIDLEMTGLDTGSDTIIEIATVVTDSALNIVAEGPSLAISRPKELLDGMDDWNQRQHGRSGLVDRVLKSVISLSQAERRTLEFLKHYVTDQESPMCGNSICQDRRFLAREMPELEAFFHYRHIDVSTIKELVSRWAPSLKKGVKKSATHLALADVHDSINELRYYREHFINVPTVV
ncbi:MAG: oligoribonuclease [Gammaproteobacteria bacterium]|nr:MAG: oligoribonuclease [Gammaproteobacteria bacterium]